MSDDASDDGSAPDYGDVGYWETRYQSNPAPFDWYQSWENLYPVFAPLFTGDEIVLNIGCGNSTMAFDMTQTFRSVTSIDFSPTVIAQMREVYAGDERLQWHVMNCFDMSFPDASFDIVFDKGTIDSILCGSQPMESVHRTLSEVERVLRAGGIFLFVSFGKPSTRVRKLRRWNLPWHLHRTMILKDPLKRGGFHYAYIFQKMSAGIAGEMKQMSEGYEDEEEEEEEEEEGFEPTDEQDDH